MKRLLIALVAVALLTGLCAGGSMMLLARPGGAPQGSGTCGWSNLAKQDIPANLLSVYDQGAHTFCPTLPCQVLAAIGKIETDHGRSNLPGVHSGTNFAGAAGPMQFLLSTWALPGIGNGGDVYNPQDAIPAAARYLCKGGAADPAHIRDAIFSYNHALWYVAEILAKAAEYTGPIGNTIGSVAGGGAAGNPFVGCTPVRTQGYGPTDLYFEPIINGVHFHTGIDLACPAGTQIRSLTSGVAHVSPGFSGGWGNRVEISSDFNVPGLGQGHWTVSYNHMLDGSIAVTEGQQVQIGAVVGREGSTGYSTGAHLHFEVDKDRAGTCCSVNPSPLLSV